MASSGCVEHVVGYSGIRTDPSSASSHGRWIDVSPRRIVDVFPGIMTAAANQEDALLMFSSPRNAPGRSRSLCVMAPPSSSFRTHLCVTSG